MKVNKLFKRLTIITGAQNVFRLFLQCEPCYSFNSNGTAQTSLLIMKGHIKRRSRINTCCFKYSYTHSDGTKLHQWNTFWVKYPVMATGPKGRKFKAGRGDGYLRSI
jgi:hypothetical protein